MCFEIDEAISYQTLIIDAYEIYFKLYRKMMVIPLIYKASLILSFKDILKIRFCNCLFTISLFSILIINCNIVFQGLVLSYSFHREKFRYSSIFFNTD